MQGIAKNLGLKLMAGFACMLVITAGGVGGLALHNSAQALTGQLNYTLPSMAHEGARLVRSRMDNQLQSLYELSINPVFNGEIGPEQMAFMQQHGQRLGYLGMGLLDRQGMAHYPDAPSADLGNRDYVRRAFEGRLNMSEVIISRVINKPVIMLAAPVRVRGEVVNVLIARMDATLLSEIVEDLGFGEQGDAQIINAQGTLIASPDRAQVLDQVNPVELSRSNAELVSLAAAIGRMLNSSQGADAYTVGGQHKLSGHALIPQTDWRVVITANADEVLAPQQRLQWLIALTTATFIGLGLVAAYYFGRQITRPLRKMRYVLQDITGQNDLRLRVPVRSRDEVGQVAGGINGLLDYFQQLLGDIQLASERVAAAAGQMNASSSRVMQVVDRQENQTHQVATAMEEMSASIQEVASNTVQAASLSGDAQRQTSSGHRDVQDTLQAITRLNDQIQQTVEVIEELSRNTADIGQVLDMIQGVAEQTNLLALNAAIEAARAGEAGRGFAVVADEVRALAGNTRTATDNIREKMEVFQRESRRAVEQMQSCEQLALSSVERAQASGLALDSIRDSVSSIEDAGLQISTATEQQSQVAHDISENVSGLSQGITEVNQAARETADAGRQLAVLAEQLHEQARRFSI